MIRRWADLLRHGHVAAAARLFALPALVANPSPAYQLDDRAAVRFFNRTLPCGARLVDSEQQGRYVVGTFVLSERPGRGSCGSGVGARARTAFLIRRHRIVQWLRAPDAPSAPRNVS